MAFISTKNHWVSSAQPLDFIEASFDGRKVDLTLVKKSRIINNCIAVDSVFYNQNKTKTNVISAFILPKISLRYYNIALTYSEFISKKEELSEVYDYLKEIILGYPGCLITDRGPLWQRLVRELLEQGKTVYVNMSHNSTDIYQCELTELTTA